VLKNIKKTLASGWNIAIQKAKGDYICRIDAHSEISNNYIKDGVATLMSKKNKRVVAIGGWLKNNSNNGLTEKSIARLLSSPFGIGNSPVRRPKSNIRVTDTVAYGIYKKKEVINSGLYDEAMLRNQDIDLNYRLHQQGYYFLTHPDMVALYNVRSSVKKILLKAFNDGEWVLKTPGKKIRHIVPFAFTLYLFFLPASIFLSSLYSYIFLFPLFIYLFCCLYYSFQKISLSSILLIFLFPLFHISYGIGTFRSLFPSK
jgi:glycosyltransferase involved in cell wall biosynthesis